MLQFPEPFESVNLILVISISLHDLLHVFMALFMQLPINSINKIMQTHCTWVMET